MLRQIVYGLLAFLLVGSVTAALVWTAYDYESVTGRGLIVFGGLLGAGLGVLIANALNKELPKGETKKSLGIFFILMGLAGVSGIFQLGKAFSHNTVDGMFMLVSVAFGIVSVYLGIMFSSLVRSKTTFVIQYLWVILFFYCFTLVVYFARSNQIIEEWASVLGISSICILLTAYLLREVSRLGKSK